MVRAGIARALGCPRYLLLLDALAERKMGVCDVTELVGADQSTVSNHLAVLYQAGIVEDRKEETMTFLSSGICCPQGFWDRVESIPDQSLEDKRAVVAL